MRGREIYGGVGVRERGEGEREIWVPSGSEREGE